MNYTEQPPDDWRGADIPAIADSLGVDAAGVEQPDAPDLAAGSCRSVPVGRRFAAEHLHGRWIHVHGLGWHRWDGRRWEPVAEDHVNAEAASWLQDWITGMVAARADSKVIAYCLRYRDIGNVRAVVAAARTHPGILVAADRLDDAAGLLNCRNGTLDLRTGRLLQHDPHRYITKVCPADYTPGASHGDWAKALSALDDQTIRYLQLMVGQAATGEPDRDDPVTFHHGLGANGKSTLLAAVAHVLGDYATTVPDSLLSSSRNEQHPTEKMPLRGARFALLEELPEDHVLPVARLKRIVGTPLMTARAIGRDFITWRPVHHLAVSTNHRPIVSDTDHGTWRRLVMIPYPKTYTSAGDPTLKRRLRGKAQSAAVLAWIAAGAADWYKGGCSTPQPPPAVAAATAEWRDIDDPLGGWLRASVKPTGKRGDRLPTSVMLERFNADLPKAARPWSARTFGERLKAHPLVRERFLGVDRGERGRDSVALAGAAWGQDDGSADDPPEPSAQVAQGLLVDSLVNPSRENLPADPVHPVRERGCADCGVPVASGYGRCPACIRAMKGAS